jgi:5-methyltetrahydropteroyltriglutamate--homocysteine methyltransferase
VLTSAVLGLPRIGRGRELKGALESHWRGETSAAELERVGGELRHRHLSTAAAAGVDVLPCGDFSLYDHVLDMAVMVGAIPRRFAGLGRSPLERYFAMARGAGTARPLEMTKWFDTNYHYLVPEISASTQFSACPEKPVREFREALGWGFRIRPVLLGPVSFLLLAKPEEGVGRPLSALDRLLDAYEQLLGALADAGAEAVQIDEPCLAGDLDQRQLWALERAWARLAGAAGRIELTLASYFGGLGSALERVLGLPAREFHLDLVSAPEQLERALRGLAPGARLSLGVIDARNVWASDLEAIVRLVEPALVHLGVDRVRLAPSCSLLHVPYTVADERRLDPRLRARIAFGEEKLRELQTLKEALTGAPTRWREVLATNRHMHAERRTTATAHQDQRVPVRPRSPRALRAAAQAQRLRLPELPSTTIGSFPQTAEIRAARRRRADGVIGGDEYERFLEEEIRVVIERQERLGLDVLVHGEPERNDMVQHFAEHLEGFAITEHGWVQSYGSRAVKPPILFADVGRPVPITVRWWRFAQDLTDRPVKAILTGPVTMLQWSFVRVDAPRESVCRQLALALGEEAQDLERAGARIIQIDEAALREGLPLRAAERPAYLRWALECFRLATRGLGDATQLHAHICYSQLDEIAGHLAQMDADVISLEAARSGMAGLDALREHPGQLGPGVYDVHSPRVPTVEEIEALLQRAERHIPRSRLWVNPDCGLKTRTWEQVELALEHLVAAAVRRRRAAPPPPPGDPRERG